MKLIIELKDETYKFFKENALLLVARGNGRILAGEVYEAIKNGAPYNDAEALAFKEEVIRMVNMGVYPEAIVEWVRESEGI